jgi:thiazole synthase
MTMKPPAKESPAANQTPLADAAPFELGAHVFQSRLIVGTGKYETFELMQESLDLSGAQCVTVAVRRERLYDGAGKNILDYIDLDRYTLLPNTAGCFNAKDAVRTARLGRDFLLGV